MNNLSISCPYCGNNVQTDLDSQIWAKNTSEILAVPLVERIGRLATTASWVSKGKDPRLGGLLSIWNNTVGLLREYQVSDVNVMKRELRCDSLDCSSAFDCYVNLDPNHSFADFWPHLTGKLDKQGHFSNSGAKSSAEMLISIGEKIGITPNSFVIILASFFCLITLFPYFLSHMQQYRFIDQAILRCSAILLVAIMVWTIKQTSEHIRSSFTALSDLLIISNHNSIQFWHNFTLGRVTGVSFPKEGRKTQSKQKKSIMHRFFSRLTVSQASIVGGIPSVLIAIIIWSTNYLPHIGKINLTVILEFIFWIVVMYFTGISAWIGFNIGVFVLQNISSVPMKLTPLNGFDNLTPVKKIAKLSLQLVIPVVLLPLLFIVTLLTFPGLQDLIQLWLLPWVRAFLGLGLILIGLGDTGILILGIIYIGLLSFLSSISGTSLISGIAVGSDEWIGLGVFGVFLSVLLGYHISRAFVPLVRIVKEKKQETIDQLNRMLVSFSDELKQIDRNISNISDSEVSRRDSILHNIKDIIDLREKVISTNIDIFDIRTSIGVASPFISSVLLPFALDTLKSKLLHPP